MIPVHAVITTHNRPDDLRDCVSAIVDQVHSTMIIDNASNPPVSIRAFSGMEVDTVIRDEEQPPNLSRLWNEGLEWSRGWAAEHRHTRWDTLILNDDFIAGPHFVERLQNALRADRCVVASPYAYSNTVGPERVDVYETAGTLANLGTRMAGFAFLLRGESGTRADESIKWLYGDDDVAQQACATGGRAVVHGLSWAHRHPDGSTLTNPLLAEQGGHDRATFVAKWGFQPW